jgi:uncharacterized membrane protein YgdD (TMEM256/DUF423 family)
MQSARSIRVGAALGALAVLAGAFGAHALQGRLADKALATYEIAVRYQTYHALALVLCGLLAERGWRTAAAARAFAAGVLVFSGSLYALVLTGATWLGAVTPLGGVLLVLGWALLALGGKDATAAAAGAR